MITAIVTFVLLLALGYIIFVHSGKQEGVNKTIGYVVIGVIAVAIIAVPVYSLARGLKGRGDFAGRGEGMPGMQGGMFAPGDPRQGGMQRFEDFGNCPQGGMPQCPQGKDDWGNGQDNQGQGRRNGQQFRGMPNGGGQGMPNGGCQMAPFCGQPPIPGQQGPGSRQRPNRPGMNGLQPGTPAIPDAQQGNRQPAIPNRNN